MASVTEAVAVLAWVIVPSGSVAVTSTRTVASSSSVVSVYVAAVASVMLT